MRRSVSRLCLAVACLSAASPDAVAQRLFANSGAALLEIDTSPRRLGRIARDFAVSGCAADGAGSRETWPVLRGRYLAWQSRTRLCVFGVLDGVVHEMDLPDGARLVAVSDDRLRVVVKQDVNTLLVLDAVPGTLRPVTLPTLGALSPTLFALASASDELVVVRGVVGGFHLSSLEIAVIDLATGALRGQASLPGTWFPIAAAVDATGARLAVTDTLAKLVILDAHRGVTLAANATLDVANPAYFRFAGNTGLIFSRARGRLLVATYQGLVEVDPATAAATGHLDLVTTRRAPSPGFDAVNLGYALHIDPATGRLVVIENEWESYSYHDSRCTRSTLLVHEPDDTTAAADLAAMHGRTLCGTEGAFFLVPTPDAPAGLSATTSPGSGPGARVDISWSASPGATHYVLEAGSAAGKADYGTLNLGTTAFTVHGVPPGRYFVRVRAVGIGGQGPRATDVAVQVP